MENQSSPQEENPHLLFMFLTMIAVVVLIVIGIFCGYVLNQNNTKDQNKAPGLLVSPVVDQGLQIPNGAANTNESTNWTIYTDVYFSIKYPTNWLVKKGFSTKDDVIVYDPTTVKQVTQNGAQARIPSSFVDILSVTASTASAAETLDAYKMQASNSAIKSEQSTALGQNLLLVNTGNGSANTILWSQNGLITQFSTSIQHLSDTSTENKILQSFQFIKQQQ